MHRLSMRVLFAAAVAVCHAGPIVAAPRSLPALQKLRGGVSPLQSLPSPAALHAAAPEKQLSSLQSWWSDNSSLILAICGALALLTPTLRSLPKMASITAGILVIALVQMAFDLPPDLVLLEAVVALVGLKVITMKDALDGFRSEGVVAVGVMTAVAKGIQVTGGLQLITKYLLGTPKGCECGTPPPSDPAAGRLPSDQWPPVAAALKPRPDASPDTSWSPAPAASRARRRDRSPPDGAGDDGDLGIYEQHPRVRDDDAHPHVVGGQPGRRPGAAADAPLVRHDARRYSHHDRLLDQPCRGERCRRVDST